MPIGRAMRWLTVFVLEKLADKIFNYAFQRYFPANLMTSVFKIDNIDARISAAENRGIRDENLKRRVRELSVHLREVADDLHSLLCEFQYQARPPQRLEQQRDEASNSTSSCSSLPPRKRRKTLSYSNMSSWYGRGDSGDDDAVKVREIQERLDDITSAVEDVITLLDADDRGENLMLTRASGSTSAFLDEIPVLGRDDELEKLVGWLLKSADGSDSSNNGISVLAIVGSRGVGKTTLARLAYKHREMREYFRFQTWIRVSENFKVERLIKKIIESVSRRECDFTDFDTLQKVLEEEIASKRFLLVLDEVPSKDSHILETLRELLRFGAQGSKILITTHFREVADMVGNDNAIHLNGLDEKNFWKVFKKCAFGSQNSKDHPQLKATAKRIAGRLNGSPLLARMLGGLLNVKMDEKHWEAMAEGVTRLLRQNQNDIMPFLQLSYQYLPRHLQRCFAFCFLFPKDHIFDEDMLINIWMGESLIAPRGNMRMEDLGRNYCHELVGRSFFQMSKRGEYEVQGIIHDLADFSFAEEFCRLDDGKPPVISGMPRHLSVFAEDVEPRTLIEYPDYHKLRTLVLLRKGRVNSVLFPPHLFKRLESIHVLILQHCGMEELPETVGDLKELRYLDISRNHRIQRLPESLCGLHNLQVLDLRGCQLQRLPQGTRKLINLRHLYAQDKVISQINEVGKLTSLQELRVFKVQKERGHKIAELNGLSQLHGSLRITNLENVESKEEASNAKLNNKEYLQELELEWTLEEESILENNALLVVEEVLESLQPHHSLKRLTIEGYSGARSPGWLKAEALSNLETLKLTNCKGWKDLSWAVDMIEIPAAKQVNHELYGQTENKFYPRLEEVVLEGMQALEELLIFDKLSCLRILRISGMLAVKKIGHGLFGVRDQGKCFARLEVLALGDMPACEEWSWAEDRELFPCLRQLSICNCPELKRLPPLPPSLEVLGLVQVGLTQLPGLWEGIDGNIPISLSLLHICRCPNLRNLEDSLLRDHLPKIHVITISDCGELTRLPMKRFKEFTTLEILTISNCPKLTTVTQDDDVGLLVLPPSIERLKLDDCGYLGKSLPGCLHNLTSLTEFEIGHCPHILSLPTEALLHPKKLTRLGIEHCSELTSMPGLRVLKSLQNLTIMGCHNLLLNEGDEQGEGLSLLELKIDSTSLLKLSPIRNTLPSIRDLAISSSRQAVMFDGEEQQLLRSLTTLERLEFTDCEDLQYLPTELHTLASLERLKIGGCPRIQTLPEKGLPNSLKEITYGDCHPMLVEQLKEHFAESIILKNFGGLKIWSTAAKDVVLVEKPVISDDPNQLDPSVLDELLANIATLSSVYHKTPDAFVSRAESATPRPDDDDYGDGNEAGNSESPSHAVDGAAAPSSSTTVSHPQTSQQAPATTAIPAAAAPVPDLLGDLIGLDNAIVPVDQPTTPAEPPLPVLLPLSTGQGLQISAQLIRHDGQTFYALLFENNTELVLDGFMIQFNKNTLGLAAAGPLQVPPLQPGASARSLLPMVLFQNVSPGPPSTLLQVAVKNNQQPVWYFNDKISLHVLFGDDGRMERVNFLETWKSLPDTNEVGTDLSNSIINNVDATIEHLTASNIFFVAKRRNANKDQDLMYLSAKIPPGIPFLIELTAVVGVPGVKCAVKTPSPEMAPLFFEAMEAQLK